MHVSAMAQFWLSLNFDIGLNFCFVIIFAHFLYVINKLGPTRYAQSTIKQICRETDISVLPCLFTPH